MSSDKTYDGMKAPTKEEIQSIKTELAALKKSIRIRPTDEEPRMRWRVALHNRPFVPKEYVVSINNACRWEGVQAVIRWFPEFLDYIQPIPYATINGMMRLDKLTADSYRMLALRGNIKHA